MAKYDALAGYLESLDRSRVHTLTFSQIERALGFALPKSAHTHTAWWANQKNGRHVQANAWRAAGWQTKETDLKAATVTFEPAVKRKPMTGAELVQILSIAQAKKGLAAKFGVRPQDVEITIRG